MSEPGLTSRRYSGYWLATDGTLQVGCECLCKPLLQRTHVLDELLAESCLACVVDAAIAQSTIADHMTVDASFHGRATPAAGVPVTSGIPTAPTISDLEVTFDSSME